MRVHWIVDHSEKSWNFFNPFISTCFVSKLAPVAGTSTEAILEKLVVYEPTKDDIEDINGKYCLCFIILLH